MRILKILTILILISQHILSQTNQWIKQSPPLTGSELKDICFVNESNGWIVGQNGVILHTSDKGISWQFQNTPLEAPPRLFSVSFLDSLNGWSAGGVFGHSYILHTSDAGKNWVEANNISADAYINDICFFSPQKGFILAAKNQDHLYITENGGESWECRTISNSNLYDIDFVNETEGVICGGTGFIAFTTDGGISWNQSLVDDVGLFKKIKMVNKNIGYVVSHTGKILKTSDGASTWQKVFESFGGRFQINALHVFNINTVIAIGGYSPNFVLKTTDGGLTWNSIDTKITPQITNWFFIEDNLGYGITWNGAIIKITNEGECYEEITEGTGDHIISMDFYNSEYGMACENSRKILLTSDGGRSWNEMNSPIQNVITNISMRSSNSFSVAGIDSIASTNDKGVTWDYRQIEGSISKTGVIPHTEKTYLITTQNKIWTNAKNEQDWIFAGEIISDGSVQDIFYLSENIVFACESMGKIFRSTDGGISWIQLADVELNFCSSIYFKDENVGWIGGGKQFGNGISPIFYKTENGGITWSLQESFEYLPDNSYPSDVSRECTGYIKEIRSYDGINLLALSDKHVFYSNDGGLHWHQQSMDFYGGNYLTSLCVIDQNNMWVAGNSRFIWKYNPYYSTGIKGKKNDISVAECSSYPNPFNSNTNIVFYVSDPQNGDPGLITIFNLTGEQIFQEKFQIKTGQNKFAWTPDKYLGSGIYYVKIDSQSKTFISKIMYVK